MFSEEDLHFNRAHNSYYSSVYYWIDSILRVRPICMPEIAAGDGLLISYLRWKLERSFTSNFRSLWCFFLVFAMIFYHEIGPFCGMAKHLEFPPSTISSYPLLFLLERKWEEGRQEI